MTTLYTLLLWVGISSGSGNLITLGPFPSEGDCDGALIAVRMSSSNLIHGLCVPIVQH